MAATNGTQAAAGANGSASTTQELESQHFSPYRSDGKLYGFVCVVIGATHPIGKAIVLELAAHGAACIYACSSTPTDNYTALAEEVNAQCPNTKIIGYPYGLKEEDTLTLIDDVLNAWGRLDIWTTTPPLPSAPSVTQTTPSSLLTAFESNTMAPFFALKYAPPAMAKTTPKGPYPNAAPKDVSYGSIVVLTSVASMHGGCGGPAETVSAHAALGVVKAGVGALKGSGVRINAVSAGTVEDGHGAGGEGRAKEVARVVGFLASGFSSYVSGANLVVDGGASAVGSFVGSA